MQRKEHAIAFTKQQQPQRTCVPIRDAQRAGCTSSIAAWVVTHAASASRDSKSKPDARNLAHVSEKQNRIQ